VRRPHHYGPLWVTLMTLLGIPLSTAAFKRFGPPLLINGTPSEPLGVYRLIAHEAREYRRGMYVVFPVPEGVRPLVYGRGWLKHGVPFLKELVGLAGDQVCVTSQALRINGQYVGPVYAQDSDGRPLPKRYGCFVVQAREFLAASRYLKNSFDGRYFGALPIETITGEARPVWTF
jgi:conjugative transfer signal peptidase TraF